MMQFHKVHRLDPPLDPSEAPTSLVVLLHGYGADGGDLLDLGREWRAALPGAVFLAPDAPTPCEMNPGGCQWWSLQEAMQAGFNMSGIGIALRETGAEALRDSFIRWLDAERVKLNLPWSRVALVGFSQGCMLALHIGLRLPAAPAGIVGFSGVLLAPQSLTAATVVKPPVLLIHGMLDMVVPFAAMNIAEAQLRAAGIKVTSLARPQLGHGIDGQGMQAAQNFLAERLMATPTP